MAFDTAPLIIAIDDQQFYLDEIGYEVQGHEFGYKPFEGPSAFEEDATTDDVNRAKLILIDYDFRSSTAIQRDLPGYIRSTFPQFSGKIVLLSLLDDFFGDNEAVRKSFDGVLNKKDLSWDRIAAHLD